MIITVFRNGTIQKWPEVGIRVAENGSVDRGGSISVHAGTWSMIMVKNCKLETARLRDPGFKIRGRDLKIPKRTESPENETSRPASQTLLRSSKSGQTFPKTHVFCVPDDVFLALTVNRYG